MTIYRIPPTIKQAAYVADLQRKLRLSDAALDAHCRRRFGVPFVELDKQQCSDLLDELARWEAVPAELQREQGQVDLPGFEVMS